MVCGGLWLLSRYKTDFANKKDYAMLKKQQMERSDIHNQQKCP